MKMIKGKQYFLYYENKDGCGVIVGGNLDSINGKKITLSDAGIIRFYFTGRIYFKSLDGPGYLQTYAINKSLTIYDKKGLKRRLLEEKI